MTIIENTCDNTEGWAVEFVDRQLGEAWNELALLAAVDDLVDRLHRFAHEFEQLIDPELRPGIYAAAAAVRVVTIGRGSGS